MDSSGTVISSVCILDTPGSLLKSIKTKRIRGKGPPIDEKDLAVQGMTIMPDLIGRILLVMQKLQ